MNNSPSSRLPQRRTFSALMWGMTLVWAGLIFYLSTGTFGGAFTTLLLAKILTLLRLRVSPHTFETLHFLFRKAAHLTEYAIFAMFLYTAQEGQGTLRWQFRRAGVCVLIAALYSMTDEFHQRFVPGRGPSPIDVGVDTLGASLGIVLIYADLWLFHRPARAATDPVNISRRG